MAHSPRTCTQVHISMPYYMLCVLCPCHHLFTWNPVDGHNIKRWECAKTNNFIVIPKTVRQPRTRPKKSIFFVCLILQLRTSPGHCDNTCFCTIYNTIALQPVFKNKHPQFWNKNWKKKKKKKQSYQRMHSIIPL